jgi:hypothetical protein
VARRRWSESRDDRAGRASSVPEHSSYCWQVKTAVISVFQSRDASIPSQLGRPPPPTSQDPRARVSIHQGSRQKSRTSSIDHLLAKSRPGSSRSANRAAASLRRAAGWHRDSGTIAGSLPNRTSEIILPARIRRGPAGSRRHGSMSSWHSTVAHVMWRSLARVRMVLSSARSIVVESKTAGG